MIIIHVGDITFSSDGELLNLCIRHSKADQQGYGTSVAAMRIFFTNTAQVFVTFLVNHLVSLVTSLAQYSTKLLISATLIIQISNPTHFALGQQLH